MKKLLSVCIAVLFVIGMVVPVYAADTKLVLSTGGTAGTYYPLGGAIARIWNTKIPSMNVTAQTTGASAENIRLINKKESELALVQSDTLDAAFNAKAPFTEAIKSMSVIAVLYPEIIQVVVRTDSPIKSIADLKGKKVGVGAPGSGTEANFRQLMDIYGLAKDDVKSQYLSFSESAEQFKDRHIDAFIVTAGIPNAAIMDIGT
jgi:TRAP transporter TAXI family solute receptor